MPLTLTGMRAVDRPSGRRAGRLVLAPLLVLVAWLVLPLADVLFHGVRRPVDTDREIRVLNLAALGRTNNAIAHALDISPRTVAKHLEHIYRKLDVNSRTSAVFAALGDRP